MADERMQEPTPQTAGSLDEVLRELDRIASDLDRVRELVRILADAPPARPREPTAARELVIFDRSTEEEPEQEHGGLRPLVLPSEERLSVLDLGPSEEPLSERASTEGSYWEADEESKSIAQIVVEHPWATVLDGLPPQAGKESTELVAPPARAVSERFRSTELAHSFCDALLVHLVILDFRPRPQRVTKAWLRDAELMFRIDQRDPEEVKALLQWLSEGADDRAAFWRPNIKSPGKFRMKYDQLVSQMRGTGAPKSKKQLDFERGMEMLARARREEAERAAAE
jgi:hypothetical protein